MRLGKVQAAGYVVDNEVALQAEVTLSDAERAPVTPEPEPAVAAV
jgi:hypothetical protein